MCLDNLEIEVLQQGVSFVRSSSQTVISTRRCCVDSKFGDSVLFREFSFYLKLSFWLNMFALMCYMMMSE